MGDLIPLFAEPEEEGEQRIGSISVELLLANGGTHSAVDIESSMVEGAHRSLCVELIREAAATLLVLADNVEARKPELITFDADGGK